MDLFREIHILPSTWRKKATLLMGIVMLGIGGNAMAIWTVFWQNDILGGMCFIAIFGYGAIRCILYGAEVENSCWLRITCLFWTIMGSCAALCYFVLLAFMSPEQSSYRSRELLAKCIMGLHVLGYLLLLKDYYQGKWKHDDYGVLG